MVFKFPLLLNTDRIKTQKEGSTMETKKTAEGLSVLI